MQDQKIRKPSRQFRRIKVRIRKVQEIFPETEIQKSLEHFRERVKTIERPKFLKTKAAHDFIKPALDRLQFEMVSTGECYVKEAKAYNRGVQLLCVEILAELIERIKKNLVSPSQEIREEIGKIQGSFSKAAYEILKTDVELIRLKKAAEKEAQLQEDKKLLENIEGLL